MQNRTSPLSLLLGAALAMPGLAMAASVNTGNITPADMRAAPVDNTLQTEVEGPDGELLATQPGEIDSDVTVTETNSDMMDDPVNTSNIMPADMRTAPVDNTIQAEVEGPDGELLATQPGALEVNEQDSSSVDAVAVQSLNKQHSNASYQPLIAGEANSGSVTSADQRTTAAPITLQEKKKDKRGELLATQPGEVELNESRRVVPR